MHRKIVCIIGTDTEIGKTYVTCKILTYLAQQGYVAAGLKPLASGTTTGKYGNLNIDVVNLFEASSIKIKFEQINPISLLQPIAPHIAALQQNISLSVRLIDELTNPIFNQIAYDTLLIEGIGGLLVPLNQHETYLDLLNYWSFPTILVVGIKLGCLNHALLTAHCLTYNNINCIGWIANCIDPNMECIDENIRFLNTKLPIPLLATVGYQGNIQPKDKFLELFL